MLEFKRVVSKAIERQNDRHSRLKGRQTSSAYTHRAYSFSTCLSFSLRCVSGECFTLRLTFRLYFRMEGLHYGGEGLDL